jgi:hypothetical protein
MFRNDNGVEERMRRSIRKAGEIVLFVILIIVVMGIWTCLWLPPF